MKTYELYIKMDCEFCRKAVSLLESKNIPFVVTVCDKDPEYLQYQKEFLGWNTVPIVVEQNEVQKQLIGGYEELERLLNEREKEQ
jgi:glutaredoxin